MKVNIPGVRSVVQVENPTTFEALHWYFPNSNWDMFLISNTPVEVAEESREHLFKKRMTVQVFHKHTHPILTSSQHRPTGPGLIQFGPGVCRGRSPCLTVAGQSDQVTFLHITVDGTVRSRGLHWQAKENAGVHWVHFSLHFVGWFIATFDSPLPRGI